jgi:hypothetical protein
MRQISSAALILALGTLASACSIERAPGAPWTNTYAFNTENVGEWRVIDRQIAGDVVTLRVAAQYPERAETIARHVIDQQLDRSPRQVTVAIYPMKTAEGEHAEAAEGEHAPEPEGAPVARITWTRPDDIAGTHVPGPLDSISSADRISDSGGVDR